MKQKQYPNKFDGERENITRFFASGKRIKTKSGRIRIIKPRQYAHMRKAAMPC
jgi:hypothetical protein